MARVKTETAANMLDLPVQTFRWMVYNGEFSEFAYGTAPCDKHKGMIYVNKERLESYLSCEDLRSASKMITALIKEK